MRSTASAGACWAVVAGLAAGCGGGARVPPDEALARVRASGGEYADLNETSDPSRWEKAAREYYRPAHLDYFEDMDRVGGGDAPGTRKLDLSPDAVRGRNAWVMWSGGNEAWWDWLARYGYGTIDLLRLVDSRARPDRFTKTGV